MEALPPAERHAFRTDAGLVAAVVRLGVAPQYAVKKDKHWILWEGYCSRLGLDLLLSTIKDR